MTSVTSAYGTPRASTVAYEHDAAGRTLVMTDPRLSKTHYAYDNLGRTTTITEAYQTANAVQTTYVYDTVYKGPVASITDPNNNTTSFAYDSMGRVTTTTYPDNTTTSQQVYADGRLDQSIDPNSNITQYGYDPAGRLSAVTIDAGDVTHLNILTSYAYDLTGNLTSITDPNLHDTSYQYDALGRQTQKHWPSGTIELYEYDAIGNMTAHTPVSTVPLDENTFTYDSLNRLDTATYFDGQTYDYDYSPTGRRTQVLDNHQGTTTYQHDELDRVTLITTPRGSVGYGYDAAHNRNLMQVTSGSHVENLTYAYDHANRLTQVVKDATETTTLSYDAGGRLNEIAYPNGVYADYDFDVMGRLDVLDYYTIPGNPFQSYDYGYDAAGNRTSMVESPGNSYQWDYNGANRLETESYIENLTQHTTTFVYDDAGNRTEENQDGQTTTYTYTDDDQIDQITLPDLSILDYDYDDRGNLSQITAGTDITTFSFDAQDRLTQITKPDTSSVVYTYDHDGRRISETIGTDELHHLWDEQSAYGDIVLEYDENDVVVATYTLAEDRIISQTRGGNTHYYLTDGQRNVRALSNSSAATTDTYRYDAYGELKDPTGTTENPYLYTGQRFDSFSELYNLRARSYDPNVGRFLSRDTYPIDFNNPIELNRYGYTANNPINGYDPTGHSLTGQSSIYTKISAAAVGLVFFGVALSYVFEDSLIYLVALRKEATGIGKKVWKKTKGAYEDAKNRIKEGLKQGLEDLAEELLTSGFPIPTIGDEFFKALESVLINEYGYSGGSGGGGRGYRFYKVVKTLLKVVLGLGISTIGGDSGTNDGTGEGNDDGECDPNRDEECQQEQTITIWHGVSGNKKSNQQMWKNPFLKNRDFSPRLPRDSDGLSFYERSYLPSNIVTPYMYPFTIIIKGNRERYSSQWTPLIEVPACAALYTSGEAFNSGPGHWSVKCNGGNDTTGTLLSTYAEANRDKTELYPNFTGEYANDRRFDWP